MSISRHTLDPKLDIVFWMLFGRESNRPLLVSLLTAVLKPAEPIVHVELLNPELERAAMDEKGIVLDLRVMLGSGEQVDIEMQSRPHPAFNERILLLLVQVVRRPAQARLRLHGASAHDRSTV